ncbi:dihydrofolate reductase family protein [Saccharibacillus qingshengii]|uniref:dihydrofolate reductase family protein n=1 Tax=Saccharibacillus qingshengii TaxID=1763540 RepID=UPI0015546633|nr:dihydrofolate reductase family protein [Saccharibacillus qingshengii]
MTKVIFGMTMSLDGFINDADGRISILYPDHQEFGKSEIMQEAIRDTGAVVMGRRTFELAGDPDHYAIDYEFQVPIFVVTHQPPVKKPKENERLSFTFVDDIEDAIRMAKQAAKGRDVSVVGGVSIGRQLLRAGLVDELQVGIMPMLLGRGQRLFEELEELPITLTKTRLIETGARTDLFFAVGPPH